jgi:hypothetical protein
MVVPKSDVSSSLRSPKLQIGILPESMMSSKLIVDLGWLEYTLGRNRNIEAVDTLRHAFGHLAHRFEPDR